nr:metalloregulator ArsR/SmtB family transcription factor [uncultured Agrobacterium sp.]
MDTPRLSSSEASDAHFIAKARFLAHLSNDVRLKLFCILSDREMTVGSLARHLGISQSALSQHLARLRADELVSTRREAQAVYYRCDNAAVKLMIETLNGIFSSRESRMVAARSRRG